MPPEVGLLHSVQPEPAPEILVLEALGSVLLKLVLLEFEGMDSVIPKSEVPEPEVPDSVLLELGVLELVLLDSRLMRMQLSYALG
jgi:hypothetical protein